MMVVGVAAERFSECDWHFRNVNVEEALIGGVGWLTGPEGRRE